jgi:hypothetical protein
MYICMYANETLLTGASEIPITIAVAPTAPDARAHQKRRLLIV